MRIFISYRRDDSAGEAGRLYDALSARFGSESVFLDVDAIPPGEDFIDLLERTVASATVMLVVIGPTWLGSISGDGRPRLDNPDDFVRAEIEAALKNRLRIVPVLVGGAPIPLPSTLPQSLAPLVRFNAVELRHSTFRADVSHLVSALERLSGSDAFTEWEQEISEDSIPREDRSAHQSRPKISLLSKIRSRAQQAFADWMDLRRASAEAARIPTSPDIVVSEQLRDLVRDARKSNVRLSKIVACIEETSSEILDSGATVDQLEEHLRYFPTGRTLPIVTARLEALLWEQASDSRQPAAFVDYLVRFPHGTYVAQARQMRDELLRAMGGFDPDTPRVFLNYRRVDSQDTADRIYSILVQAMPTQNITMDVDRKSIIPGLSIEVQLQRLVDECDFMFTLINNRWRDEISRRQPQHETGEQIDFVRAELKYALARGDAMPVVPILAESVEHPQASELPEDIRGLARRSSIRLSRDKFSEDLLAVLKQLTAHFNAMRRK